jgi:uncharacterized protein YndB with AHSA1/START domain
MARIATVLGAPPDRVFDLLGDPRSLDYFVVGTKFIRRFDPHWPDKGTKVHHSVGVGPLVVRDETEVLESVPDHRLVLEARVRPFGIFRVEFELSPHPEGTELSVNEFPVGGPSALPGLATLVDRLIALRNVEMGRRLQKLTERRERQRAMAHSGD